MELSDKITAVGRMQAYIAAHLDEDITLDALAETAGYSKYHAVRIFKELTGKSPFDTIRALRLTKAAQSLQGSDEKMVDVAFDSGFDSHEASRGHLRGSLALHLKNTTGLSLLTRTGYPLGSVIVPMGDNTSFYGFFFDCILPQQLCSLDQHTYCSYP